MNTSIDNLIILNGNHSVKDASRSNSNSSSGNHYLTTRHHIQLNNNLDHNDLNEIKAFAFDSCKEYLGGIWKTIKLSQFHLEKIS